jgi:hypothetical protein
MSGMYQDPTPVPGGDTYITNTYYGIECGDISTPCYVTFGEVPQQITGTVAITSPTTFPVYAMQPPYNPDNSVILLAVFVFVFAKFVIIMLTDIPDRSVLNRTYHLLITGAFIAIDLAVVYPWTMGGLHVGTYTIPFSMWLIFVMYDKIIALLTGLTGGRG